MKEQFPKIRFEVLIIASVGLLAFACWFYYQSQPVCILYGKPPHHTSSDFADEWIGFGDYENAFYRLNLRTNGSGTLARTYVDGDTSSYIISKWSVISNAAICEFQQTTNESDPLKMICDARLAPLTAILSGKGAGGKDGKWTEENGYWKEEIVFRRATIIETNFQKLGIKVLTETN